jgi:hypothetical protein
MPLSTIVQLYRDGQLDGRGSQSTRRKQKTICHSETTLPIDKMLNFDSNTTDTQKQQLFHGDIILAHNKPIICLPLHLAVAISTKS